MKKLAVQTVICTTVISATAFGLSRIRGGVFWRVLHEDLMLLGMFGVVGGVISMFAGSGPIGRPERMNGGYDPSLGLILLLSGIANLVMSIWVFNHPRFFNSFG
jgi:ABC-type maltose transport system permease subunit